MEALAVPEMTFQLALTIGPAGIIAAAAVLVVLGILWVMKGGDRYD